MEAERPRRREMNASVPQVQLNRRTFGREGGPPDVECGFRP